MPESAGTCTYGILGGLMIVHSFGRCPIAQPNYSLFNNEQEFQEKVAFLLRTGIPPPLFLKADMKISLYHCSICHGHRKTTYLPSDIS